MFLYLPWLHILPLYTWKYFKICLTSRAEKIMHQNRLLQFVEPVSTFAYSFYIACCLSLSVAPVTQQQQELLRSVREIQRQISQIHIIAG